MIAFMLITLLFAGLAIISFIKIRQHHGVIHFIYHWAFPVGSFVWEDLFVFSLYGLVAGLTTLCTGQIRIGLLFFIVFWVVRSAGETLYFFLQQFIRPKHSPHYLESFHFKLLRRIFGPLNDQQAYILLQVFFQTILMLSSVALILLILHWEVVL